MESPRRAAISLISVLALAAGPWPASAAAAAGLDDLYGQLVPPKRILSETQFEHYKMREKGSHGSAAYGAFESRPEMDSLGETLRISLSAATELSVGYTQGFNNNYDRSTENNADVVAARQVYHIDEDLAFQAGLRHRRGEQEYFFSALRKDTRTSWDFATSQTAAPVYFNDFDSQYTDVRLGIRALSPAADAEPRGLDLYDRPLLADAQRGWEAAGGYRSGELTRRGVYYVADRYNYDYSFRTTGHAVTSARYRLGIDAKTELEAGLVWESPFKYKFGYDYSRLSGTSYSVHGTYDYQQWFEAPIALRLRPSPKVELRPGVNLRYIDQKLTYWEKREDTTQVHYPEKKLAYYGVEPSVKLSWLAGREPAAVVKPVYDFNEKVLGRGQWAFTAEWSRRIDSLDRGHGTGGYNLSDPYEEYLDPVANFVGGTEYAAFSGGNSGATPADVDPQNSTEIKGQASVGLTDRLSLGLGAGYRSSASAHQLSLGDLSERFYKFKPVYFFDLTSAWQFRDNALFALDLHYVPSYQTFMISSANPEEYKATTRYVVAVVKLKILF